MNKSQILEAIENAKKTHLEQMNKIRSVMNGNKIENPTALSKMECECGVWFYNNEAVMKGILGAQLFDRLDIAHENWHKEYLHIYNIFFKEERKTGFFAKILKQDKIDGLTLDKAKMYFIELQKTTDELMQASESASRRVNALSETKFK